MACYGKGARHNCVMLCHVLSFYVMLCHVATGARVTIVSCHVMLCHVSALCVPLLQRLCLSGVPKVDQGDTIMTMIMIVINDNDDDENNDNDDPGALLELPEQPCQPRQHLPPHAQVVQLRPRPQEHPGQYKSKVLQF